jgi:S-adenosylmethionine hydrolase
MLIGLLTDFGTTDAYVGVMKGVILRIAPSTQIVDITHAVQPQNIRQAAQLLKDAYAYFPEGTIFVVVVDPGVGSERRPVAVRAGGYTFVAPDNGVLSYVLRNTAYSHAVALTNPAYRLELTSSTFHGRDIFAPAAAHLAAGARFEDLGGSVFDLVMLESPVLEVSGAQVKGEVTHIDHFGNIVTSIGKFRWSAPDALELRLDSTGEAIPVSAERTIVTIGNTILRGIRHTYSEVTAGTLLTLIGSSGSLEIAMNAGNAALRLNAEIGAPVTMKMR